MKYFVLLTISIFSLQSIAQGYSREYNESCDCYEVKNHYDNGQLSAHYFESEDGKRQGEEKSYYPDGQLQLTRNWVNGKIHGEGIHYHRNGEVYYVENYENGNRIGKWTFYDSEGDKVYTIDYLTGKAGDADYEYFSADVLYLKQTVRNGNLVEETVVNQEIYDAKKEEAEAAASLKKLK